MVDFTIERRDGYMTVNEYRAVVTVQGRTKAGPWQFTKKHARLDVEALRRSLFDSEEAERQMAANQQHRCDRIRQMQMVDRRIRDRAS